ncbi:hypothetical protein V8E36_000701 [Tilletia maclaganii]
MMSSSSSSAIDGAVQVALPSWPPALTNPQLQTLASASTDYALAHGLVYRPPPPPTTANGSFSPPTDSVIHAPFSLLPSPFPRILFERAHGPPSHTTTDQQRQSLPALYAHLYARVTLDHAFLERVIGANVAQVDEFQGELWKRYLVVRAELSSLPETQKTIGHRLHLGLFRSDYLLHTPDEDPDSGGAETGAGVGVKLELKQVEYNTISASFGSLSTRAGELHRFLHTSTGAFFGTAPAQLESEDALPPNQALQTLAAGLAAAHRAYVEDSRASSSSSSSSSMLPPVILFVVQPGERNAFDQRWLEYELGATYGIRVLRATFDELAGHVRPSSHSVNPAQGSYGASLQGPQKRLHVRLPGHTALRSDGDGGTTEISVVYFRAGYGPGDYPAGGSAWDVRVLLERSGAIKCPTIALQLAGAKKVQQVLAEPGVLESFLLPASYSSEEEGQAANSTPFIQADLDLLRSTFSGLWPLDPRSDLGREGLRLARTEPTRFVLKPQREGGGNNIYRDDIPAFLDKLPPGGEEGYILMELIKPPRGVGNYLMRAGKGTEEGPQLAGDVVSELGVYSTALFGAASSEQQHQQQGQGLEVVHQGYGGYLLRTKGRESDEGGVAVGYSVIDSVVLV